MTDCSTRPLTSNSEIPMRFTRRSHPRSKMARMRPGCKCSSDRGAIVTDTEGEREDQAQDARARSGRRAPFRSGGDVLDAAARVERSKWRDSDDTVTGSPRSVPGYLIEQLPTFFAAD